MEDNGDDNSTGATAVTAGGNGRNGKPVIVMICGSLVYYHCAYQKSSFVSLISDVFIVLLYSLAILDLLFRQMNIPYVSNSMLLSRFICQSVSGM
nr:reticulon-like protein B22 [Ipomoea batatas]